MIVYKHVNLPKCLKGTEKIDIVHLAKFHSTAWLLVNVARRAHPYEETLDLLVRWLDKNKKYSAKWWFNGDESRGRK